MTTTLKRWLRPLVDRTASAPSVLALARRRLARRGVTVLMYHEIGRDDDTVDVWQVVRESDFLRQAEHLRRHYDVVTVDEALSRLPGLDEGERPLAVITLDDGNRGNLERLLPLVEREALPVTVYIASEHIEAQSTYWFDRIVNLCQTGAPLALDLSAFGLGHWSFNQDFGAANWARIQALLQRLKSFDMARCDEVAAAVAAQVGERPHVRALAPLTPSEVGQLGASRWVTIGAHTHGHEVLTLLDDAQILASVQANQERLARWTGRTAHHFAYPSGICDQRVRDVIRQAGFRSAMGTWSGVWRPSDDPFWIPRIAVGRYDDFARFKANTVLGPVSAVRLALGLPPSGNAGRAASAGYGV